MCTVLYTGVIILTLAHVSLLSSRTSPTSLSNNHSNESNNLEISRQIDAKQTFGDGSY